MIILEEQAGLNAGLNKFRIRMPKLSVAKFISKNVKSANKDVGKAAKKYVTLKNAIAVGSIAAMVIPGGQVVGVAAKLAKLGRIGKLAVKAMKIAKSPLGQIVMNKIKNGIALNQSDQNVVTEMAVAQDQDPSTPNVLSPEQFSTVTAGSGLVQATQPTIDQKSNNVTPTPQQLQTIAQVKGVPADTLTMDSAVNEALPNESQLETISKVKDIPVDNLKEEVATKKEIVKNETANPTDKPNYTIPIVIGVGALGAVLLVTSSKSNQ